MTPPLHLCCGGHRAARPADHMSLIGVQSDGGDIIAILQRNVTFRAIAAPRQVAVPPFKQRCRRAAAVVQHQLSLIWPSLPSSRDSPGLAIQDDLIKIGGARYPAMRSADILHADVAVR